MRICSGETNTPRGRMNSSAMALRRAKRPALGTRCRRFCCVSKITLRISRAQTETGNSDAAAPGAACGSSGSAACGCGTPAAGGWASWMEAT